MRLFRHLSGLPVYRPLARSTDGTDRLDERIGLYTTVEISVAKSLQKWPTWAQRLYVVMVSPSSLPGTWKYFQMTPKSASVVLAT
jgi:hypothetical protein